MTRAVAERKKKSRPGGSRPRGSSWASSSWRIGGFSLPPPPTHAGVDRRDYRSALSWLKNVNTDDPLLGFHSGSSSPTNVDLSPCCSYYPACYCDEQQEKTYTSLVLPRDDEVCNSWSDQQPLSLPSTLDVCHPSSSVEPRPIPYPRPSSTRRPNSLPLKVETLSQSKSCSLLNPSYDTRSFPSRSIDLNRSSSVSERLFHAPGNQFPTSGLPVASASHILRNESVDGEPSVRRVPLCLDVVTTTTATRSNLSNSSIDLTHCGSTIVAETIGLSQCFTTPMSAGLQLHSSVSEVCVPENFVSSVDSWASQTNTKFTASQIPASLCFTEHSSLVGQRNDLPFSSHSSSAFDFSSSVTHSLIAPSFGPVSHVECSQDRRSPRSSSVQDRLILRIGSSGQQELDGDDEPLERHAGRIQSQDASSVCGHVQDVPQSTRDTLGSSHQQQFSQPCTQGYIQLGDNLQESNGPNQKVNDKYSGEESYSVKNSASAGTSFPLSESSVSSRTTSDYANFRHHETESNLNYSDRDNANDKLNQGISVIKSKPDSFDASDHVASDSSMESWHDEASSKCSSSETKTKTSRTSEDACDSLENSDLVISDSTDTLENDGCNGSDAILEQHVYDCSSTVVTNKRSGAVVPDVGDGAVEMHKSSVVKNNTGTDINDLADTHKSSVVKSSTSTHINNVSNVDVDTHQESSVQNNIGTDVDNEFSVGVDTLRRNSGFGATVQTFGRKGSVAVLEDVGCGGNDAMLVAQSATTPLVAPEENILPTASGYADSFYSGQFGPEDVWLGDEDVDIPGNFLFNSHISSGFIHMQPVYVV